MTLLTMVVWTLLQSTTKGLLLPATSGTGIGGFSSAFQVQGNMDDLFERLSRESQRAMFAARFAVTAHGGQSLEPEHVLLGIVQRSPGRIVKFGDPACVATLEKQVMSIISSPQKPGLNDSVRTSARLAEAFTRLPRERNIEVEHLLLALVDDRGDAGRLLRECDVSRDAIQAFLQNPTH